eukprot:gene3855-biopygen3167
MRNPRAKQTFSGEDAASLIAQDIWNAMNPNHAESVSREAFTATFAADGARANVRALLVLASSQRGASDARLAEYEPTLRRILRFESYKLAGEGSAALAGGGKSTVRLARGHALELEMEKSDGKGVRLKVNWQEGRRSLMNTGL